MKLEVGKFYRTRDGRKVEITLYDDKSGDYPIFGSDSVWRTNTGRDWPGQDSSKDIIAEWQDEPNCSCNAEHEGECSSAEIPHCEPTRARILNTAKEAVTKDRNDTHGNPEDTFADIASLWSAYLGEQIQPYDVCNMMALLKIARAKQNPKHDDNWIDIAGYAACGAEVAG